MKNISIRFALTLLISLVFSTGHPQSYQALNGSPYAGGLENLTNPASAINTPFSWDLSVLGFQSNTVSNGLQIKNFALSSNINIKNTNIFEPTDGFGTRKIDNNADLHLLNFRYQIDNISCFSFGIRVRSVSHVETSAFNYNDTISGYQSLLHYNTITSGPTPLSLKGYNEAWTENDFSYSKIFRDYDKYRVSGGVTLGLLKGLSGAYGSVNNLAYKEVDKNGVPQYYSLTGGEVTYLYSNNYNALDSSYSTLKNLSKLKQYARYSLGLSFGFEYILKEDVFDEKYNPQNYYWKFDISMMDIGSNRFITDPSSTDVKAPKLNATDTAIVYQYHHGIDGFYKNNGRRSLLNNFQDTLTMEGAYRMSLPTRVVASVDRNFGNNWYLNVMGSLNIYSNNIKSIYHIKTRELNRLVLNPRYETSAWGVYMPVQYTANQQVLVGLAFKAGPLLFGLHNFMWLQKSKLEKLEGGYYLALHFHPYDKKRHHILDCY